MTDRRQDPVGVEFPDFAVRRTQAPAHRTGDDVLEHVIGRIHAAQAIGRERLVALVRAGLVHDRGDIAAVDAGQPIAEGMGPAFREADVVPELAQRMVVTREGMACELEVRLGPDLFARGRIDGVVAGLAACALLYRTADADRPAVVRAEHRQREIADAIVRHDVAQPVVAGRTGEGGFLPDHEMVCAGAAVLAAEPGDVAAMAVIHDAMRDLRQVLLAIHGLVGGEAQIGRQTRTAEGAGRIERAVFVDGLGDQIGLVGAQVGPIRIAAGSAAMTAGNEVAVGADRIDGESRCVKGARLILHAIHVLGALLGRNDVRLGLFQQGRDRSVHGIGAHRLFGLVERIRALLRRALIAELGLGPGRDLGHRRCAGEQTDEREHAHEATAPALSKQSDGTHFQNSFNVFCIVHPNFSLKRSRFARPRRAAGKVVNRTGKSLRRTEISIAFSSCGNISAISEHPDSTVTDGITGRGTARPRTPPAPRARRYRR
jgi:hypothetical protein